jgi:uncharacterized protein with FMN-binding domain
MEKRKSNTSKMLVGLVVVLIIAIGIWYYRQNKTPTTDTIPVVIQSYKDGTYSSIGTYTSPAGKEEVGVSLTLRDNIITSVTFTPKATHEVSIKLQGMFSSGYKELVVGKDINTVKLDKVSGSSLTPKGFNDAIEKIKLQAQA